MFGAGLIEAIPDAAILKNMKADTSIKARLGISGHPNAIISGTANRSANDGTITRFGWKAQNKSLLVFAGEAYNVEEGITNNLFQNERESDPNCQFNATPESAIPLVAEDSVSPAGSFQEDIESFSAFMRLLAPPAPSATVPGGAASITHGAAVFNQAGCGLCHTPSLPTTNTSTIAALGGQVANLYSDISLHHMGPGLADGISQGQAGPDEFRTAPLWGLGKRAFFLHDGRTSDLVMAIHQHRSAASGAMVSVAHTKASLP